MRKNNSSSHCLLLLTISILLINYHTHKSFLLQLKTIQIKSFAPVPAVSATISSQCPSARRVLLGNSKGEHCPSRASKLEPECISAKTCQGETDGQWDGTSKDAFSRA